MKTVLLGLDGATFTILDHLVATGVMPHLGEMYRRGARALLGSTPLPLTPQAWTTMATGRNPGHHGIADWIRCEQGASGTYCHLNNARDNHCETLWSYASRQGKRVTVLNYFGLAPPSPINGHTMPGFTSGRHLRRSSYPADLFARLEGVSGFDVKVLGMDFDVEMQGLQEMDHENWARWIDHQIARDRVWMSVMEHLMRTEPSDLTAMVLDGTDKLQHLAYRFLDPALRPAQPTPWEQQVTERCQAYYRQVDDFLGRLAELVGAWGRLFIVSDHGFTGTQEIVYINRWLCDQGLLHWRGEVPEDQAEACQTDRPAQDANLVDLERSRAYALTPSSNGVFLNVPPSEYVAFRDDLIDKLLALRGPDGGQVITEVKKREDWFAGPYINHFPDLTLTLRDHGFVSVLNGRAPVVPRSVPNGTHHPDGILVATGTGVQAGVDAGKYYLLDIAPLLAHSLGLEIPADYEGELPERIYDPAYLASDRPRQAQAAAEPAPASVASGGDAAGELDAEDEAIIMARLKSLGYIE
ncbi:MAG: alkaline phosphatase family protein [Pirellulales bacterium]|nr:alkaline phosphatase family protein [Pirellulales bacterium]